MVKTMRSCLSGPNLVSLKDEASKISYKITPKEKNGKCNSIYPCARWKHAAVVYQNHLYIMGGYSWVTILKDLWRLDLKAFNKTIQDHVGIYGFWNTFDSHEVHLELWQDLSNFIGHIPPLQSHTMVAYNNQIYIYGGTFVYDIRDCPLWVYSLEFQIMRKWKVSGKDEVPAPRRNHSCSIYKDSMVIYGGFGDIRGSFGDLWLFNFKIEKWHLLWSPQRSSIDPLYTQNKVGPCSRHDHKSIIHNDYMLLYGGMNGLEKCTDLWKWNFGEAQWTRINFKVGPMDLQYITDIKIRRNWVFYGVNESKKRPERWKYSFRLNKWTVDFSNLSDLPSHSTFCLSNNDNHKGFSINKYDHLNMRRNKVHPISETSIETVESTGKICMKSCVTVHSLKTNVNDNFVKLTPVDVIVDKYAYRNLDYLGQFETSFIENDGAAVNEDEPKSKEYILLVGNNIDKASFEKSIGIKYSLL